MRAFMGTIGGSGVLAALAAGGKWTAAAIAVVVVALIFLAYRLVRWILDSDDRTRRAKELLHGGRRDSAPPGS
jgi:membrane protein implicated in regulation of membrane protease activity